MIIVLNARKAPSSSVVNVLEDSTLSTVPYRWPRNNGGHISYFELTYEYKLNWL
jgi:hypothetical protein